MNVTTPCESIDVNQKAGLSIQSACTVAIPRNYNKEREREKKKEEKSSSVPELETKIHCYILAKSIPGEKNLCAYAEFGSLKQIPSNESLHSCMKSDGFGSGGNNDSNSGANTGVMEAVSQEHCQVLRAYRHLLLK